MAKYLKIINRIRGGASVWSEASPASVVAINAFFNTAIGSFFNESININAGSNIILNRNLTVNAVANVANLSVVSSAKNTLVNKTIDFFGSNGVQFTENSAISLVSSLQNIALQSYQVQSSMLVDLYLSNYSDIDFVLFSEFLVSFELVVLVSADFDAKSFYVLNCDVVSFANALFSSEISNINYSDNELITMVSKITNLIVSNSDISELLQCESKIENIVVFNSNIY